jgi:hypothetical protein
MRSPRFRRWVVALAAAAVVAGLLGWQWRAGDAEPRAGGNGGSGQVSVDTAALGNAGPAGGTGGPLGAAGLAARRQQLALWQQRYTRAEQVYSSYRDATRYPPESRPINEHPDQVRPFEPIAENMPLRDASGKPAKGLSIRTTQERVFLGGAESVKFTIEAVDGSGRTVPLVIERSAAQSMPDTAALITLIRAEVPFTDNGMAPDDAAGDGRYSARLVPAAQGFAGHSGTIRVLVEVSADGQKGVVPFDVVYVPAVPATWVGVREALEEGSLNFYLMAQVRTPGRYVASARVYDANGAPFALLQFNDEVSAGPAEFKLTLAGVLVHDRNPAFPVRLVDVEGFLLKPDTFPDREMMPRRSGEAHVSRRYDVNSFSSAEWQSEERERYLDAYGRDVEQARREIARLR